MGAEVFFGRRNLKLYCPSSVKVKFLKYFEANFEVLSSGGFTADRKL